MGTWDEHPFAGDAYLDYIIKLERGIDPYYDIRRTLVAANLEVENNSEAIYEAYAAVGIVASALDLNVGEYGGQPQAFLSRPEIRAITKAQWIALLPLALRVTIILLDERSGVYRSNAEHADKVKDPMYLEKYVQVRSGIQHKLLSYAASVSG